MTKKYYQQPKLKIVILDEDDLVTSSPTIYTTENTINKYYQPSSLWRDEGVVLGDGAIDY